jgi:hypothetical protein
MPLGAICWKPRAGVEAIWEGQQWLADGFDNLTRTIGRTVAGTFSTTKAEDGIRAADTPPTRPTLDRRRERLLASVLAAPRDTPKRALLPPGAADDSSRRRLSPWFQGASDNAGLIIEGQQMERNSLATVEAFHCSLRSTARMKCVQKVLTPSSSAQRGK